jgi:hypothetical protein
MNDNLLNLAHGNIVNNFYNHSNMRKTMKSFVKIRLIWSGVYISGVCISSLLAIQISVKGIVGLSKPYLKY